MSPGTKATVVILLLAVGLSHWRITSVSGQVDSLAAVPAQISEESRQAQEAIRAAQDAAIKGQEDLLQSRLEQSAASVSKVQVEQLEGRLRKLLDEISGSQAELTRLREESSRVASGLPELVDLDQLNQYYVEIFSRQTSSSFATVESFTTSVGQISFQQHHFSFVYLPNTTELVSLRIGKEASTENSELIKAWLQEASRAKVALGYTKVHERRRPSDYGEYTEALYRKGDMFFRTFLQHQRVQGTYGRHSLEYTYYVETGSTSRNERFQLEQYNNKLGS